jgi:hypothetical protein
MISDCLPGEEMTNGKSLIASSLRIINRHVSVDLCAPTSLPTNCGILARSFDNIRFAVKASS